MNHVARRIIAYLDPVNDVITAARANLHLNLIRTDQTTLIELYLNSAINKCSAYLGYSLRRATVDYYFEISATATIQELKIPENVIGVTSVSYRNDSDATVALVAADFDFVNNGRYIPVISIINAPPSFSDYDWAYKVRVTEGFYISGGLDGASTADETDILPADITTAILLNLTHIYENRNQVNIVNTYELANGSEHFLFPYSKRQIL